jgi:8-oxo-dGTP diphosphatase
MLVVGAAIVREGACLVARRGPQMRAAGKWEFPGGKVEAGETAAEALIREIAEELDVMISVGDFVGRGEVGDVLLEVYLAAVTSGVPRALEHAEIAWLGPEELSLLDWAAPDIPIVAPLVAHLRSV